MPRGNYTSLLTRPSRDSRVSSPLVAALIVLALSLVASCHASCRCSRGGGGGSPDAAPADAQTGTTVSVSNQRGAATTVYASFGADSKVTASTWSSFCVGGGLACSFPLAGGATRSLPTAGAYLNVTLSFDGQGCGATKAEVNVNNPSWYDVLDVSLVDGYSNDVSIVATPTLGDAGAVTIGPPLGQVGNERVYGLFPYGCDVCVARQSPPCGIPPSPKPGSGGCKSGTQYAPSVPCQWQGVVKGGGALAVSVVLMP